MGVKVQVWDLGQVRVLWAGGRLGTYTVISTSVQGVPLPQDMCNSQRSSTVSAGTRKWKSRMLPYQL